MTRTIILAALAASIAAACGGEMAVLETLSPDETCRRTLRVGPIGVAEPVATALADTAGEEAAAESASRPSEVEVEWVVPRSDTHRGQLNAWCAAVGPAVYGGWAEPPTGRVDSLVVVSWNVHVGGGDLDRLVSDLRQGVFTQGRAVRHFVLLLQEAHREDDTVPSFDPLLPLGSGVAAAPPRGGRRDIVEMAEELGLAILYVPSMRNGEGRGDEEPEDRGNAILSTLPLAAPRAIELPVARQRRVAAAARVVTAPPSAGAVATEPDGPLVASVHLENDAAGWGGDEAARLAQAEALLEGLPDADLAIAAGDFNTWRRAQNEAAVAAMLEEFPETPAFPPGNTYVRGYGLLQRYLDYVFVRLPDGAGADVLRVPDPYASDHYPLLARVALPPPETDS